MTALRRLAEYCDYKQGLPEMLRDRLLSNPKSAIVRKHTHIGISANKGKLRLVNEERLLTIEIILVSTGFEILAPATLE